MTEVAAPATIPEPAPAVDPPAPTPETPAPAAPDDVASLPDWSQKVIRDLREESATRRTKLTDQEATHKASLDAIAKALGLTPEDDPAKAAQTAADERDAARLENKKTQVENAVLRAASKNGANPEALTDSRAFMRALEAIDPAADDFAAQVDQAIKTAVEANPNLRAGAPTPARSGGTVGGGAPAHLSDDPQQRSRDYYAQQANK